MQKPRSSGEAFPHESKTTHSSNNNKVLPPKVRISGRKPILYAGRTTKYCVSHSL